MAITPIENLKDFAHNRPPVMVFMACLGFFAIILMSLAYYVKLTEEIPDPDIRQDWNQFLKRFAKLEFCIQYNTSDIVTPLHTTTTTASSIQTITQGVHSIRERDLTTTDVYDRTSPKSCESVNDTGIEYYTTMLPQKTTDVYWATFCRQRPVIHIQPTIDPALTVYLSLMDRSVINLHLMHTSYFLFVMVVTILCYALIRGRPLKSKITQTETNSILEDYQVIWNQKLGCGISGPVRPCKNKKTGERLALKCLIDRPKARQEVNLHLKCIGHPHIVHIYDIYVNEVQFPGESEPKSRLLLVMELMDGGELFDRISRQKYFTESQAARYTKQIVLAIQRCHSLNIAHRDIKPENLLLKDNSEDALIKLSDFGFAKIDEGDLTTPHFTPYYVAPQVLEAQKQRAREKYCIMSQASPYTYDKSCDMWSLGVIIYIMLCGYPPFYSETPSKQITRTMRKKILAGHYDFPDEEWKQISSMAKDLIKKLLTVDAEVRLTVDQVLLHPWLSEAPNTQLQSPAILMDKNAMFETRQEHSRQLTNMRLPDNQLKLKPLGYVNNPILRKRQASSVTPSSKLESTAPPKQHPADLGLQKLRNIIAFCLLPATGDNESHVNLLPGLMCTACQYYSLDNTFQNILKQCHWNGQTFQEPVDTKHLAELLSEFITNQSTS
ncbi:hypothetical protein LSH36_108g06046 [Paralvinella palmiformis]|uniref:non-specific serine/threonine protein kinase n=1 Tax=Paralvinella palmiformis TaxID=53620 RepID=A0AAD9JZ29_9ANNE|nr:hypothetical protein LSH36_108g06046 [Paralvinella palmiformis]